MTAVAWVLVGVAALVAAAAARPARRSRLALAIAVAGTTVTLCAVIYAALGYGGCSDRGDCGAIGGLLRTVIVLGLLGLPVLLVISALAWGWNRIPRHRRIPALSRRDGMLAACGVFLIGIGLAMAATRSNGPLGGIAVMLFGGACVVVPLSTVLARRAAGAPCLGHVEQDGALLPALIVPASTVKVRLLGLGIGCFLGASLILWLAPSSLAGEGSDPGKAEFAGLFGTVVFGLAALISLATWHRRRRVALLPSGLRWEMGGRPNFAAWEDIEDVGTFALRGTRFLTIDVREGTASRSLGQRAMAAANRAVSRTDASIGLDILPVDGDRLVETIARCCDSPARRRAIGTPESLEWLGSRAGDGSRRARRGRRSGPRPRRPGGR
jgi:hypothetical protein